MNFTRSAPSSPSTTAMNLRSGCKKRSTSNMWARECRSCRAALLLQVPLVNLAELRQRRSGRSFIGKSVVIQWKRRVLDDLTEQRFQRPGRVSDPIIAQYRRIVSPHAGQSFVLVADSEAEGKPNSLRFAA